MEFLGRVRSGGPHPDDPAGGGPGTSNVVFERDFSVHIAVGASVYNTRVNQFFAIPAYLESRRGFELTMGRNNRMEIAGQIIHQMTDQLTIMPLFYDPGIGFVANRLRNVPSMGDLPPWNAHQWDVSN